MIALEGNIPKSGCILAGAPANRIHGRHFLENAPRNSELTELTERPKMMSPKKKNTSMKHSLKLASGKLLHNYGKTKSLMGKSSINDHFP